MNSNEKYLRYIIPELQEFWKEHRDNYINSGLTDGLFLPYAFERYDRCNKKIFYIGQDAPYWLSGECMTTLFDENKYLQYVLINHEVMRPLEKRFAWGNNSSAFWPMVIKVHMYLMTNTWYNDIYNISSQDLEWLETIGYGNANSVPLLRTIWNYWEDTNIQQMNYYDVVRGSYCFNHLGAIIDNYEPDTIIILGRSFNVGSFFRETDIFPYGAFSYKENGVHAEVVNHKGKKIRIVWTYNPNYYKFIGENMHSIANKIKKYA